MSADIQYLKEVSRVPAPFSARRFTDSDDEVWGGLPEKPAGSRVVRIRTWGVQEPGEFCHLRAPNGSPRSLTYGRHLSDLWLQPPHLEDTWGLVRG